MTSHRHPLARLSTSVALAALLLGGCALDGFGSRPSRLAAAPLKSGGGKAVARAERAVLAAPRAAAARAALGAAYLEAGRFASAVAAYDAALELGDESVATVLGLALAETAQGNRGDALALLNDWRDAIPASDLGLALALAGDAGRGVAILTEAVRNGDTSAKTRQNLAFGYALAGRWLEARLMAAQDLPLDQVDARITEWALLARPDNTLGRVAHLLGAPVVADPGQPAALALSNFPTTEELALQAAAETQPQSQPEPAQVEAAEPAQAVATAAEVSAPATPAAELPALAQAAPPLLAVPEVRPAPITLAAFEPPAPAARVASDAPAIVAAPAPAPAVKPRVVGSYVAQQGPIKSARRAAAKPAPARPRSGARTAAPKVVAGGSHWVQLGSYTDPAIAADGWGKFTSRTPALKSYRATTTSVTIGGAKHWRVSAAGFASYADAATMCRTVRSRGGSCLVVSAPRDWGSRAFASLKR